MAQQGASFRSALRHRDYRWLASSFVVSNIGSWAYNVALIVWVFDRTGSAGWVGAVALARFVPALLFSPYGGVLAERFERRNLVVTLNLTSAATHVLMAVTVATNGPVLIALVLASLATIQGTIYEPGVVALTPQIVGETDLAAANALNGVIDNGAVIIGPAVGAVLLIWFAPAVTLLINAATFVYAAGAVRMVRTRSHPSDVTEGGGKGPIAQMAVGFKALAESGTARFLASFSILASFYYGADTVLFIVLSEDRLGTGANGYGYLLTALGVGGIIAAPIVNRLASMPRLGTIIAVGLIMYTLPMAAMTFITAPPLGFAVQVVRGAGTLVVDVLAITAMQRTLSNDLVSRVYGVFVSLVLAAISLGALVTPWLLSSAGLNGTLLIYGLGTTVGVLVGYPRLLKVDRVAKKRLSDLAPRIKALEASPLFAALSRPGIEQLAVAATELDAPVHQAIVTQGDKADAVYLIVEGMISVAAHGADGIEHRVADLGPGDFFGEIGLIGHTRRNATCTAATPCRLYRIDGDAFLSAVGHAPGTGFLDQARHRASQTHRIVASETG